jgi:hypothetical protein
MVVRDVGHDRLVEAIVDMVRNVIGMVPIRLSQRCWILSDPGRQVNDGWKNTKNISISVGVTADVLTYPLCKCMFIVRQYK